LKLAGRHRVRRVVVCGKDDETKTWAGGGQKPTGREGKKLFLIGLGIHRRNKVKTFRMGFGKKRGKSTV